MGAPDRRVSVWYDTRVVHWPEAARALRQILLDGPLDEAFKWRGPVYVLGSANLCMVGDYRDAAVLSFFKGVLLGDPEGILEPSGPNSRAARVVRVTSAEEVATLRPVLEAYIHEAVELERAGAKVTLPPDDMDYPEELVQRLDGYPEFFEAWSALTPGRRRGWVLHFAGAKQSATRASRIDKAEAKILLGRGLHDR
ncbi:YdeI/OmpD-associated family protein [Pseudooceanicola sp. C21-150M6]|uniref:YdeI/OmpD-associated family protein n=1 Tax=Pseudooceanicola sp. C21-150M6 TaxID=3434355 RepID=UPI003D7F487B